MPASRHSSIRNPQKSTKKFSGAVSAAPVLFCLPNHTLKKKGEGRMLKPTKKIGENGLCAVLLGLGSSWFITLILALIASFLLLTEKMDIDSIKPMAVATIIAATTLSSLIVKTKCKSVNAIVIIYSAGLMYYLSLIGCNALIFHGKFIGLFGGVLTILGCCTICIILPTRQKRQRSPYLKTIRKG